MRVTKVLKRHTFTRPIYAIAGDTVVLSHTGPNGEDMKLVEHVLTKAMRFDEGVIAEVEFEGQTGVAGMFLEPKPEPLEA